MYPRIIFLASANVWFPEHHPTAWKRAVAWGGDTRQRVFSRVIGIQPRIRSLWFCCPERKQKRGFKTIEKLFWFLDFRSRCPAQLVLPQPTDVPTCLPRRHTLTKGIVPRMRLPQHPSLPLYPPARSSAVHLLACCSCTTQMAEKLESEKTRLVGSPPKLTNH